MGSAWLTPDVLVCFAVRNESRRFQAPPQPVTKLLFTGMGAINAERAVRRELEIRQPRLLLSCGYAGGLNPRHKLGTVLFDATTAPRLKQPLLNLGAIEGHFQTTDRVIVTSEEKEALFASSQADAVEMESSAIMNVGRLYGIPSATIRVISDTAQEDLPMDFNALAGADGNVSYLKLLKVLASQPSKLFELRQFQKRLTVASESLGRVLQGLLACGDIL